MTFKTIAVHIFAYAQPTPPLQTGYNISMIYCIKIHKIFTRYRKLIYGLYVGIGFAIFPTVVECQHTKWRQSV